MNINTLNSRIRALYNHSFTKEDISDMIDIDDFFPDEELTYAGYLPKNTSQEIVDKIAQQIPKFNDVKNEMLETIGAEEDKKILTESQAKSRIADEYRAKQNLLGKISESSEAYYSLVKDVAARQKVSLQEAEARIVSTPTGMGWANANTRAGEIEHHMKRKPVGSYKEAYDLIKDYEGNYEKVLRELDAMRMKKRGVDY